MYVKETTKAGGAPGTVEKGIPVPPVEAKTVNVVPVGPPVGEYVSYP